MKLQPEVVQKLKGLLILTPMLLGISFIALFIYVRFVSPTARATVVSGLFVLLTGTLLALLVGLNIIYFSIRMKNKHPGLARHLPLVFMMVIFGFWVFGFLHVYSFSPKRVILFSLVSLGTWLVLNLIRHFSKVRVH